MKTTHEKTEPEKAERKYPYIGQMEGGKTVLFSSPEKGTVIHCEYASIIGEYYEKWMESQFTPLPKGEKIILEND